MSTPTAALSLCLAGVGVSMVYQIRQDRDPIPVLVIGGIFTGVTVAIASVNPDVGTALAAVFFLGMFLTRGDEILNFVNSTVSGQSSVAQSDKPKSRKKRKAN